MQVYCQGPAGFQSTLPRGERHRPETTREDGGEFQSTLPRGERRSAFYAAAWSRNFNPRSHEGSDARGDGQHGQGSEDFNPRSHEGSDYSHTERTPSTQNFNPRSHEGSDKMAATLANVPEISIHAPTRGATIEPKTINGRRK